MNTAESTSKIRPSIETRQDLNQVTAIARKAHLARGLYRTGAAASRAQGWRTLGKGLLTVALGALGVLGLGTGGCAAQGADSPEPAVPAQTTGSGIVSPREKGEVRAVWVTRWDYRTADNVRAIVRNSASVGCTRIFFQVRGEATCFFRSSVEPWAWELSGKVEDLGKDPGWDPLAVAIEAGREHNVDIHAWLNVLPAWKNPKPAPAGSKHVTIEHPEWIMHDSSGRRMTVERAKFYTFLNPALPEVRAHLVRVFTDMVRSYPGLVGVHYDYIRYPGELGDGDFSHDPYSLKLFKEESGGLTPARDPEQWQRWRATQIERLLEVLAGEIRRINPQLEISAAVTARYDEATKKNGQRSLEWIDAGLVDSLVPMAYHYDPDAYGRFLDTFLGARRPTKGSVIIGIYPEESWEKRGYDRSMLVRQIADARKRGAQGVAIFAYSRLFPEHRAGNWSRYVAAPECFGAPQNETELPRPLSR